jgi:hypothetical protein
MRSQSFLPEPQDLFVSNDGSLADSQAKLKSLLQQRTGISLTANFFAQAPRSA